MDPFNKIWTEVKGIEYADEKTPSLLDQKPSLDRETKAQVGDSLDPHTPRDLVLERDSQKSCDQEQSGPITERKTPKRRPKMAWVAI